MMDPDTELEIRAKQEVASLKTDAEQRGRRIGESTGFRMAKATQRDMEAAKKLLSMIETGQTTDRTIARFLDDNIGSLNRVIWGMAVILDPNNAVVDPDSDVLQIHPSLTRKGGQA